MIHFLTYANDTYKLALKRIEKEAHYFGKFDHIHIKTQHNLDQEFIHKHKTIMDVPFGGGYYIWKPYIIHQQLETLNDNDILVYCDAGSCVNKNGIKRFSEYIELLNQNPTLGCICFQLNKNEFGVETRWTKKEIFQHFGVLNDNTVTNTPQICATICILKKNPFSINLINKWVNILEKDDTLFDNTSRIPQLPDFKETRWDQSIFSMLCKTEKGILVLADETYPPRKSRKNPFIATRSNKAHGHNDKYMLVKGIHIPP